MVYSLCEYGSNFGRRDVRATMRSIVLLLLALLGTEAAGLRRAGQPAAEQAEPAGAEPPGVSHVLVLKKQAGVEYKMESLLEGRFRPRTRAAASPRTAAWAPR